MATSLNNLGLLNQLQSRFAESELLYRRALALHEKWLPHPDFVQTLGNLGTLELTRKDWTSALAYLRRATKIMIERGGAMASGPNSAGDTEIRRATRIFRMHALAAYRNGSQDAALREEGYQLAQWAERTSAAAALSQMAARAAKGEGALAGFIRDLQDVEAEMAAADTRLSAGLGKADLRQAEEVRRQNTDSKARWNEIHERLGTEYKEYIELLHPKPISIEATQAQLRADEVLLLFLDTPELPGIPGESFGWAVTKDETRWVKFALSPKDIFERVTALRCGLDLAAWEGDGAVNCGNLTNFQDKPKTQKSLPFDLARAHELYVVLFDWINDLTKGKRLLIVPSGPLVQLPFQVLLTEKPYQAMVGAAALRRATWLAKSNAITVLPSVTSLKALREYAKTRRATKTLVGFGNPLLDGRPNVRSDAERAKLAREKQKCPKGPGQLSSRIAVTSLKMPQPRGGLANVADVRAQVPLPETADELCAVARELGVPESDIRLGARATEGSVKAMSEDGSLAKYRIVHFATHGTLASEATEILGAAAVPGLILTPPAPPETTQDDGYLSSPEIAGLKLDADWVILSACNTAAGGAPGAEALSGMARAFFYAGARSLLVSHWAVDSDSTVKLITKALGVMATDKSVGRAEAMRRSMLAMIEAGDPEHAHPSFWAPFVVVGEGSAPASSTAARTPAKKSAPKSRGGTPVDWAVEILRP